MTSSLVLRETLWNVPFWVALGVAILAGSSDTGHAAEPPTGAAILQQLRSFATMGSVLYIAAHPDDENTQVITYLARGRGYRTAYLSLTRGDGGQNLLGPQLGEALGVAPTHGHHTASAVLAVEAFRLAADPAAFPEQLRELRPWQARRIVHNVGLGAAAANPGGGMAVAGSPANVPDGPGVVKVEVGGRDPVSGESFASIAARSRGMHKTQGFGNGGLPVNEGSRIEPFVLLAGDAAANELLDGVDTTWNRVPGGAEIARSTNEAIAKFNVQDTAASVPALLAIRRRLAALPADPMVSDKREQLDPIIQACLGLEVDTVADRAEVVPGERVKLRHTAVVRSRIPVRWTAVRYPSVHRAITKAIALRPNQRVVREDSEVVPASTPPSQPYWLRTEGTVGLFDVDDPSLIGRPENPPTLPLEYVFDVGGQTLVIAGEPRPAADPARPALRRRLEVIAPVSVRFIAGVRLFAPGAARPVTVDLTAARARAVGTVRLDAPPAWNVTPASQPFRLAASGAHARFTFTVTAPPQLATAPLGASVEINGQRFNQQRIEVRYDHLPLQLLQPPASAHAVSLELATRGRHVGYLPGAGDDVPAALEQMGYEVTPLTGADLTPERLRGLDAVVIGIRAFNVRTDLAERLPGLFAYVEAGGTVVAQYNTLDGLREGWLAPFQLHLSRDRVTDEHAPVTILAPEHPALTTPNRITAADFEGWVQERGLYFPDQWDERFTPILASGDAGETPLKGGLLVARQGKGYFVYTSLAWFRQLPEAVPGAYRLFANLASLGK